MSVKISDLPETKSDSQAFNEILELLGSDHRVHTGDIMSEGFSALFQAIPSYIDRKIEEALKEHLVTHSFQSPKQ